MYIRRDKIYSNLKLIIYKATKRQSYLQDAFVHGRMYDRKTPPRIFKKFQNDNMLVFPIVVWITKWIYKYYFSNFIIDRTSKF